MDQILRQCGRGKSANAVRSVLASSSSWATAGELPGEHLGDEVDLGADFLLPGLGEDRADGGGDHLAVAFADLRQHVAHEVHAAALPRGALEDGADGVGEATVGVADDQLDAVEAAVA